MSAIQGFVDKLGPTSSVDEQLEAARSLGRLRNEECIAAVAAGAIPFLVALLSAGTNACVQENVCMALVELAEGNPDHQRKLAAAGAIPSLVELLSSSTPASVQLQAAMAIGSLNHKNPDTQGETVAAGAIPLMVALLSAGSTAGGRSDLELCRAREAEKENARQAANDVAQEMIEEEEREKASKEAKAKSKKGKKQRQKERKKGKDQKGQTCNGDQLSQDQVSAVEDQDADAHLIQEQQQPAGGSAEGGGDAGEPSGIGMASLGGDEDHSLSPSAVDREPRGSGSATAPAANTTTAAANSTSNTNTTAASTSTSTPSNTNTTTAAATIAATNDDSRLCIVCMERERDVCLQPCRHVSMCSPCCEEVLAKKRECPICRTKVVEHVRLMWS
eukprot:gene9422-biopygen2877